MLTPTRCAGYATPQTEFLRRFNLLWLCFGCGPDDYDSTRKTCRCSEFNVVIMRLAFTHARDERACVRADAARSHWNICNDQKQQLASAQLAWVLFLTALPLNAYACHAKNF
jgi:hypothetical protein